MTTRTLANLVENYFKALHSLTLTINCAQKSKHPDTWLDELEQWQTETTNAKAALQRAASLALERRDDAVC